MALRPDTGIPFDATYDPDAAYAYEQSGAGLISPGPMESGPIQPEADAPNTVGINPEGMWWVNGKKFHRDDHQSAVESQQALDGPIKPLPAGYRAVGPDEYKGYLRQIIDPSVGRLMSKNFGIGVDVSQQLKGSDLKFFGAEETGQKVIDQQTEDLRFNQPYQRKFTDIKSIGDAGMWFVANIAQMAPLMVEMIAISLLTGGAGGIAAGAATGGAKFLARGAAKKAVSNAATKTEAMAAIRGARMVKEGKLVKDSAEHKALRKAGRVFGAKVGAIAASEGVAIGDIYQAVEESGNYDSPTLARLVTLVASIPYAAAEVLPVFAAAKLATRGGGTSFLKRGNRASRFAKGAGAGIAVEGPTELVQDMLSLGAAGELDLHDPEVRNQLINAFAAGAGFGAPLGGAVAMIGRTPKVDKVDVEKEQSDILNPGKQEEMFDTEDSALGGLTNLYEQTDDEGVSLSDAQDAALSDATVNARSIDAFEEAAQAEFDAASAAGDGQAMVIAERKLEAAAQARTNLATELDGVGEFARTPDEVQDDRLAEQPELDFNRGPTDLLDPDQGELFASRDAFVPTPTLGQQELALEGGRAATPAPPLGEQLSFDLQDTRQGELPLPPGPPISAHEIAEPVYVETPVPNLAIADALEAAQQQQVAQQVAQQEAAQQQEAMFGPAELQQMQQDYRQAGVPSTEQLELPGTEMEGMPASFAPVAEGTFAQNNFLPAEPSITMPVSVIENGKVVGKVQQEVPVRQALEDSERRVSALKALRSCLKRGG